MFSEADFQTVADYGRPRKAHPDDNLIVTFEHRAVEDGAETARQGRPIFKEVEFVTIQTPGSKDCLSRKVRDDDIKRFRSRYDAWKERKKEPETGMPLKEWPLLTVSQIAELQAISIFSVEQLAGVPESSLHRLGIGGRAMVERAKDYLEFAKGQAPINELRLKHEQLQAIFEQMAKDNDFLRTRVDYLERELGAKKAGPLSALAEEAVISGGGSPTFKPLREFDNSVPEIKTRKKG